jgi:hypothetical protein
MMDHVWVFKFMYMVVTGASSNDHYVWKVSGNPRATGTTGTLAINTYITSFTSSDLLRSMQSLEQFGFYLTVEDSSGVETVYQYQLDMEVDSSSSSGALLLDSDLYDYVETTANIIESTKTFTPDTSYSQRLFQQTSYMYQNRPIYAIVGKTSDYVTYRTSVFEYTSFIQTPAKFEIDETSRPLDFY